MANNKSAEKRIRVAETHRQRNKPYRTAARTFVKKAQVAVDGGDPTTAATAVGDALSTLDRVASKGVIHKNNAARRKSRLMKRFNQLTAGSASS